ncbi:LLM class flavin-dependent oxidoreductase [Georgenia ruanii]|uniref:LLM class flavin-dependent oxidoreductase n=1 Tax=Georgenia ruanii TaxID=348442 RepID=UPI0012658A66|nr:LLM class flavin-dependent oxidoreductase [Georgenia ruanii]
MRLSIMLAGGGGMRVSDMVSLAVRAEVAGADGVYMPEAWRSGFVTLSAIAVATSRLSLGPYVLNAHARTPMIAGMSAVDLDELSGGRLVLGVGSGNRVTNESYQGVPVIRPLEKMRDYLAVLRGVVEARYGQRVDYVGARHSMSGWHPQVSPVRSRIPILLAATSPKMAQVAYERADGLALGSLLTREYVAQARAEGQRAAGESFTVTAASFVSVDDDRERARNAARSAVVNLYAGKPHPHYDSLLRQQGFADVADAVGEAVEAGDLAAARSAVSDSVVDRLTIAGTREDCLARLEDYSDLADELILVNVNTMRYQAGDHAVGAAATGTQDSFSPLLGLIEEASSRR